MDGEIEGRLLAHRMVLGVLVQIAGPFAEAALQSLIASGEASADEGWAITKQLHAIDELTEILRNAHFRPDPEP